MTTCRNPRQGVGIWCSDFHEGELYGDIDTDAANWRAAVCERAATQPCNEHDYLLAYVLAEQPLSAEANWVKCVG